MVAINQVSESFWKSTSTHILLPMWERHQPQLFYCSLLSSLPGPDVLLYCSAMLASCPRPRPRPFPRPFPRPSCHNPTSLIFLLLVIVLVLRASDDVLRNWGPLFVILHSLLHLPALNPSPQVSPTEGHHAPDRPQGRAGTGRKVESSSSRSALLSVLCPPWHSHPRVTTGLARG